MRALQFVSFYGLSGFKLAVSLAVILVKKFKNAARWSISDWVRPRGKNIGLRHVDFGKGRGAERQRSFG